MRSQQAANIKAQQEIKLEAQHEAAMSEKQDLDQKYEMKSVIKVHTRLTDLKNTVEQSKKKIVVFSNPKNLIDYFSFAS